MGKVLMLSFDSNEEDVISEILNILKNRQIEYNSKNIQKCLEFQDLKINIVRRMVLKGNKEIKLTYTEFEILLLLAVI